MSDEPKSQDKPKAAEKQPKKPDVWDRGGEWLIKHGALPALGVITLAVLFIHIGVFRGESAGDDLSFHFAESARISDCLRVFDLDLWNPSANAGYASAYYYQVIPQLASAIPAAIFGHHLFFFQLSIVLPLILAPAAAYRGLRLLGATPWQAAAGAFCVAFTNGESRWGGGNAGTFQVGLYTQTWALAALPLALGHAARWMRDAKSLAPAIAWGAFVFLCHPFAGATLGLAIFVAWVWQCAMVGIDLGLAQIAPPLVKAGGWRAWLGNRWTKDKLEQRPLLQPLLRGALLAGLYGLTWMPVIAPLAIDRNGFGGFPHRVGDEVGPGFVGLWRWYHNGAILDYLPRNIGVRLPILTYAFPILLVLARGKMFRWLWPPALFFALLLGLGPHIGKIGDDLFPPVRALGTMQCLIAMGVGAGTVILGQNLWELVGRWPTQAYALRTAIAAAAAALAVLVALPGGRALWIRIHVFGDYKNSHRDELMEISRQLGKLPAGRKQPGPGAENHWMNLLPYAYDRVPALLQMGGGGLQASPNYDFLWSTRDYVKNAWIYDAPYVVFSKAMGSKMPLGEDVGGTENYVIRRLPTAGLVSPVHVTGTLIPGYKNTEPGHKQAIEWEKSDAPIKDEVLAYAGSGGPGPEPHGKTLRAWHQPSPGSEADIVAEVQADAPTTFEIHESWHPRWHAYIDGNEVAVRRLTPDFPGVDVPTGKHTIELRFERPWWALGVWLLWPGAAVGAWLVTRRKKPVKVEPPKAIVVKDGVKE